MAPMMGSPPGYVDTSFFPMMQPDPNALFIDGSGIHKGGPVFGGPIALAEAETEQISQEEGDALSETQNDAEAKAQSDTEASTDCTTEASVEGEALGEASIETTTEAETESQSEAEEKKKNTMPPPPKKPSMEKALNAGKAELDKMKKVIREELTGKIAISH